MLALDLSFSSDARSRPSETANREREADTLSASSSSSYTFSPRDESSNPSLSPHHQHSNSHSSVATPLPLPRRAPHTHASTHSGFTGFTGFSGDSTALMELEEKDTDNTSRPLSPVSPPFSTGAAATAAATVAAHHHANSSVSVGVNVRVPGAGSPTNASQSSSPNLVNSPKPISRSTTAPDSGDSVSRPLNVQRVLHVEWDEELQAFTGVPDVWREHLPQSRRHLRSDYLPSHLSPSIGLVRSNSLWSTSSRSSSKKQEAKFPRPRATPSMAMPQPRELQLPPSNIGIGVGMTSDGDVRQRERSDSSQRRRRRSQDVGAGRSGLDRPKYASLPKDFKPARAARSKKVSVREYLSSLGFSDLDRKYDMSFLTASLLSKLSLSLEGSHLVRMPFWLKLKIFSYLDSSSLVAACSTCTDLLQFNDHHLLWKPLVLEKNARQRTLYSDRCAIMNDWKRTFISMSHLDVDPTHFDQLWNVVVVGDRKVGKSRLVWSLAESANQANERKHGVNADDPVINAVSGIYRLGIDLVTRRVVVGSDVIKLQVWDGNALVGGADRVPFQNTHVVMMVFDVCNKQSFDRIPAILETTRKEVEDQQDVTGNVPMLLFANTTDHMKDKERVVPSKDAKRFANERGLIYLEANANDPQSVDKAFANLAEECINFSYLETQSSTRLRHNSKGVCSIQ